MATYDWLYVDNADRIIDWTLAGVPGGIPTRTTVYTTLNAGSTAAQINSAISACPSGQVVSLGAGTFNLSTSINMKSGITLRVAGAGSTILNATFSGNIINMVGNYNTSGPSSGITAGNTKGSQTITLSSASSFNVGNIIVVDELNDPSFVTNDGGEGACSWCSRSNGTRTLGEMHIITAKNGNTLTLSNPLAYGYNRTPQAYNWATSPVTDAGVENMTLKANSTSLSDVIAINMLCAARCWAYSVEFSTNPKKGIWAEACTMLEAEHCYFHDPGNWGADHGYAISGQYQTSYSRFADNIFYNMHANVAFGSGGGAANVAAYNYGHNCRHEQINWFIHCFATHGSHTYMNLWEGNVMPKIGFDAIWGSGSHQMVFRNNIRDACPGVAVTTNLAGIQIAAWQQKDSFIGNVLGYPGYGGTYNYVSDGAYCLWQFVNSDAATQNSLIRHGNYDYVNNGTVWDDDYGQDIPVSLGYSSKPSWFGSLHWPPIGPDVSGLISDIPAKWRWDNYQVSNDIADIFTHDIGEITGWTNTFNASIIVSSSETARLYVEHPHIRVVAGTSATYAIWAEAYNDFTADITLDATGLPTNATDAYGTNPIAYNGSTVATITTTDVAAGTYSIYFTGTAVGGEVGSVRVILEVVESDDCAPKVPIRKIRVKQGDNAVFTVIADPTENYTGAMDLSASGVPTGATGTFGETQIDYNESTTFTVDSGTASIGEHEITITGEGPA
jgi:hypothetical protein